MPVVRAYWRRRVLGYRDVTRVRLVLDDTTAALRAHVNAHHLALVICDTRPHEFQGRAVEDTFHSITSVT